MKKAVNTESEQAKVYYKGELNKLFNPVHGTIKLYDSFGNSTKCMAINKDSIEVLVEFLNSLKK